MRVLLTGHQGYLGTVMAPVLAAAGHEVIGLDSGLFADCVLGPAPAECRASPVDLRDVAGRAAGRVRRGGAPGGAVQRPAGLAGPRADLRHQPPRLHPAGPAGQGGGRRAASSTPPPARCTARVRRRAARRGRAAAAGHAVRGVQGPGRGRPDRAGRRRLLPGVPAQRHRVRVLAAAARRHRAQQPGRARLPDRRGARCCRTARRGGRWCTPRTSRARSLAALAAPRDAVHGRASTSAPSRTTARSPRSPQAVVEAVPGSKLAITGETGDDPRSYRVDFSRARKELGFEAGWTIPDGANQLATGVPRARPHPRAVRPALHPPRRARRAAEGGRAGRHHARQGLSTAPPDCGVGLVAE